MLERIGETHMVGHLDEVEPIRAACELSGESCVILSFVPPHKTTLFMRVPLIPVFAWEYETIPFEVWDGQPKHDWRMVLQQQGRAITLSKHSAGVVRKTLGENFPATAIPPPVFDRWKELRERIGGRYPKPSVLDQIEIMIDTATIVFSPDTAIPDVPPTASRREIEPAASPATRQEHDEPSLLSGLIERVVGQYRKQLRPFTPAPVAKIIAGAGRGAWRATRGMRSLLDGKQIPAPGLLVAAPIPVASMPVFAMPPPIENLPLPLPLAQPISKAVGKSQERRPGPELSLSAPLKLEGVVYFAVVNPNAGRKNWNDLISAFTWAFRDTADAVLVVKVVGNEPRESWKECFTSLRKQPAFACRVVLIHGFLDAERMGSILEASSYVINTSSGEGCALPLLEGMAAGRPAIAPDHTAMADYINSSNSFIVRSHLEVTAFPHDGRVARRTMWRLPRWDSLRDAFVESYQVARRDSDRWLSMANEAITTQRAFCSDDVVERRIRDFLGIQDKTPSLSTWTRDLASIPVDEANTCESMVG